MTTKSLDSRLDSFQGWDSSLQLSYLFPEKKDQALVTLKTQEQNLLLLGRLSFKNQTLEILNQTIIEDKFTRYWAPLGNNLILATRETGGIDLYDQVTFTKKRRLREDDPLQVKDSRKYKSLSRRSKYWAILSRPASHEGKISFWWNKVFDQYGEPYKSPVIKSLILDESGRIEESDVVVLGTYGNKKLVYHWMEMEVYVEE